MSAPDFMPPWDGGGSCTLYDVLIFSASRFQSVIAPIHEYKAKRSWAISLGDRIPEDLADDLAVANDDDIRLRQRGQTPLAPGDTLAIVPSIAGGRQ